MPELLNSKQAADKLQISPLTLSQYAREKRLEAVKVGREWLFSLSSVEAFKAARDKAKAEKRVKANG